MYLYPFYSNVFLAFYTRTFIVLKTSICILLLSLTICSAQVSGSIEGRIVDGQTNQGLGSATITLLERNATESSKPITGTIAKKNGDFTIANIASGTYALRVRYIGYRDTLLSDITITPAVLQLGNIALIPTLQSGREVTVSGQREQIEVKSDKRVYTVGKDLTVAGGTITDVLQNVPAVSIDQDRSIQLRGSSNVTILIDGKPSMLLGGGRGGSGLDQLPADAIEAVEVITNPSAKYDAEGTGGIINIILRKDQLSGLNGSVNISAGTRDKYTASYSGNWKTALTNLSLNFSASRQNFFNRFYSSLDSRQSSSQNSPSRLFINQYSQSDNRFDQYIPRITFDWNLNPSTTLSVGGGVNLRSSTTPGGVDYRFLDSTQTETMQQTRLNTEDEKVQIYDMTASVRSLIATGHRIVFDARGSQSNSLTNLLGRQFIFLEVQPFEQQRTTTLAKSTLLTISADYEWKIAKSTRLETGLKSTQRILVNDIAAQLFDTIPQAFVNDSGITNTIDYNEHVFAGYATYSGTLGRFGYSAGLRAENTTIRIIQRTTGQNIPSSYLDFFPSLYGKYRLSDYSEISLSYSRRINRPTVEALNPFPQFADPFNLRLGNPQLRPDYTHSFDLSAQLLTEMITVNPSVYYRTTNNIIFRFREIDSNTTTTTFVNLGSSQTAGSEWIIQSSIFSWWRANLSANVFMQWLDASNVQPGLTNSGVGMNLRVNNTFQIADGLSAQISYAVFKPAVIAQGSIRPIPALDIALRYEFLDTRASIGLRISDIFDERQFSLSTRTVGFDQDFTRKRESRIGFLNFSYRFGIDDSSAQPPRREDQPRMEESGGY